MIAFIRPVASAAALVCAIVAPAAAQPHIDDLDPVIERLMDEGHFPGAAVAVMRDGEAVHVGAYGAASLEHGVPVTPDTVFELASLTKQMTALAVMTLVEEGRLSLDAPVTDFVEDAPEAWGAITVDMLLSHMAGLDHRFEETADGVLLTDYSRENMLESAKATPMLSEPGTDWSYSDEGYFLLGVIVEAVTGQTFDEYMQAEYFEPLGMAQTRFLDQSAIVPHRAEGYAWKDGEIKRNRRVWQFELTPHFGVMSSLKDMMKWEAELADPEIINAAAMQAAWEIQREFDAGERCDRWGYARGWWSHVAGGKRIVTHAGYSGTAYVRAVDDGVSAIVLTNRQDGQDLMSPFAIAWAAAHAVEPSIPDSGLKCWE